LLSPFLVSGAPPAFAAPSATYTCTGTLGSPGAVPGGTYRSLAMPAGSACAISAGSVVVGSPVTLGNGSVLVVLAGSLTINGGLSVGPNAVFGAGFIANQTPLTVNGPVRVGSNSALVVGTETPYGALFASLNGPVNAKDASSVQIHNTSVSGPVRITGGGTDNAILDGFSGFQSNFSDLEDNQLGGPVSETGYRGEWGGVLRNVIDGPLTFSNNSEAPNIDEYDIGSNLIKGPATCNDNVPAPNMGHSRGSPSIVRGPTRGDQANTCTGVSTGVSGPPV
jgi:hypothetical protein